MKNIGFWAMVALCLAVCGEAVPQNLGSIRVSTPMYTASQTDAAISDFSNTGTVLKATSIGNAGYWQDETGVVWRVQADWFYTLNGKDYTDSEMDVNFGGGYLFWGVDYPYYYAPEDVNRTFTGWFVSDGSGSSPLGIYTVQDWQNAATNKNLSFAQYYFTEGEVTARRFVPNIVGRVALTNDIPRSADLTDATNYTDSVAAEFEDGTRTVSTASTANVADDAFLLYDSQGLVSYSATDLLLGATNAAEAALSSKRDLSDLNIYADPSANHTPLTVTVWHSEEIHDVYTLQWDETYQSWRYVSGKTSFVVSLNGDGSYAINAGLEDYGGEVHTISRIITLSAPKWSTTISNVPGFNRLEIESIPTQIATEDFVNSRGFVIATKANIIGSLSQGADNRADGLCAHAEGTNTVASERFAHSEGYETVASGVAAKASGLYSISSGRATIALGADSHASNDFSFVWNTYDKGPAGHYYGSHGIGSFNINPRNGLAGVWIGETNLQNHINAEVSSKADASDLSYSLVTPGEWEINPPTYQGFTLGLDWRNGTWVALIDGDEFGVFPDGDEDALELSFVLDITYTATRASLPGHLFNRANNLVKSSDTLQVTLPPPIPNKSRDFRVRLVITEPITSPDKITFVGATTNGVQESISFESENGNFPSLNTISTNILHFTETAPSLFYISNKIAIPTPAP